MQNIGWSVLIMCLILPSGLFGQVEKGNLLFNWKSDTLSGSSQYDNTYNEVWGLAVHGNEYGIIGSVAGTHFIDVTDPEVSYEAFFIEGASSGNHIIHRDYHDFKGYLYTVSDEDTPDDKGGLQIIDISELPQSVELVYESADLVRKAHNIFIDTSKAILYVCTAKGGVSTFSALTLFDISNPLEPELISSFPNEIAGISVGHVHDAFVQNGIAYLHCGYDGFLIVDFNNPSNPKLLTHLVGTDYQQSGYNHSGWLSEDGKYYYFADENFGSSLKSLNVEDKENVINGNIFDAGYENPSKSIPHNPIVLCNYLFVSYYYDGLQVYDLSEPSNPMRVMYYPTSLLNNRDNYEGAWGVYPFLPSGNILVSDMQNGLFVIEKFTDYCHTTNTIEYADLVSDIKVSPNPSSGVILIKSDHQIQEVSLFSSSGSKLLNLKNMDVKEIDLSSYQNGIYFLQFIIDGTIHTEKIIIQH